MLLAITVWQWYINFACIIIISSSAKPTYRVNCDCFFFFLNWSKWCSVQCAQLIIIWHSHICVRLIEIDSLFCIHILSPFVSICIDWDSFAAFAFLCFFFRVIAVVSVVVGVLVAVSIHRNSIIIVMCVCPRAQAIDIFLEANFGGCVNTID